MYVHDNEPVNYICFQLFFPLCFLTLPFVFSQFGAANFLSKRESNRNCNLIVKRKKIKEARFYGNLSILTTIFLVYRPGYGQCSTNVTRLASHDSRYKRANILNTGGIHVLRWITSEHKKDFSERESGCTDPMMHFDPLLTCVARIRKVKRFKSCSLVLFANRFDEPLFAIL